MYLIKDARIGASHGCCASGEASLEHRIGRPRTGSRLFLECLRTFETSSAFNSFFRVGDRRSSNPRTRLLLSRSTIILSASGSVEKTFPCLTVTYMAFISPSNSSQAKILRACFSPVRQKVFGSKESRRHDQRGSLRLRRAFHSHVEPLVVDGMNWSPEACSVHLPLSRVPRSLHKTD